MHKQHTNILQFLIGDYIGDSIWDYIGDYIGDYIWDYIGDYIGDLYKPRAWSSLPPGAGNPQKI